MYVRCICHNLNLIVQSAFEDIRRNDRKVGNVEIFISSYVGRINIYKQICERNKLRYKKNYNIGGIQLIVCWKLHKNIKQL